ncbi:MAG: aspartate--tRNA ligase [Coprobacillus sp.]|nr:aspartate--tRNA ligase [Coprobacillus sp.]
MKDRVYSTSLDAASIGETVTVTGWISKIRNLGAIRFIDLRDRKGIVQLVLSDKFDIDLRNEYVVKASGTVRKRETPNPRLKSGEIEIECESLMVLSKAVTTPLIIADETDALEDTRLKYRYLDLRRPVNQNYLDIRHKIKLATHEYLSSQGFIEVETPILTLSTPEGARDYLVPSRTKKGNFYALPQSPQIFKQLLMIGGIEKYYQIARCFRDEDLRSDRQPEFTQIDIEMSFMDQDEILSLNEGLIKEIFSKSIGYEVETPFKRISYKDAIELYGTDKPDTRFDLKLVDVKPILHSSEFNGFHAEAVKAIVIPGAAPTASRKVVDELSSEARKYLADGVVTLKMDKARQLDGSIMKFISIGMENSLIYTLNLKKDDLVIIAYGDYMRVSYFLGALRLKYGKELGLIKEDKYDFLWVVDFPLFEKDVEGSITSVHHPFTRPKEEDIPLLDTDPLKVLSSSYDLIINGYEAGGGSLRIYDEDIQKKIFKILGLSDEDIKNRFGFFMDAFKYGTPPHGGIALGLDRLTMLLGGTDNIRDVIAFPKNLNAICPTSGAPAPVSEDQLDELGIEIKREDN